MPDGVSAAARRGRVWGDILLADARISCLIAAVSTRGFHNLDRENLDRDTRDMVELLDQQLSSLRRYRQLHRLD